MLLQHIRLARRTLLFIDALAAVGLFVLVSVLRLGGSWQDAWLDAGAPWWVWALAYGILWAVCEWLLGLHLLRARWTFRAEAGDILQAAVLLAVTVFSLLFLVHAPGVSRLLLVLLFSSQIVFSAVQRRVIRGVLAAGRHAGLGRHHILVLGTNEAAVAVAERLERHPTLGYRIAGFLGTPSASCPRVLGSIDDLQTVIHESIVDEIVAALDPAELTHLEAIAFVCGQEGKRLRVVLHEGVTPILGGRTETVGRYSIMTVANGPDRLLGLLVKRLVDMALAAVALVALAPVLLVIAATVRLHDRGPVLFRQTRIGLNGRPFQILKFRTMVPDAEQRLGELATRNEIDGQAFKLADDPRITAVGRVLRRTSLDELPQFWNVLRGQMSIVGPRPPLPTEVAGYDIWHRRRLSMKPGITGLWQVSARSDAEFDRWVELDLSYIDRWSLWLDIQIMLRTVPAMLGGR